MSIGDLDKNKKQAALLLCYLFLQFLKLDNIDMYNRPFIRAIGNIIVIFLLDVVKNIDCPYLEYDRICFVKRDIYTPKYPIHYHNQLFV